MYGGQIPFNEEDYSYQQNELPDHPIVFISLAYQEHFA